MAGGLLQLVVEGCISCSYTMTGIFKAIPFNTRDSIQYWFIDNEDGIAKEKDINFQNVVNNNLIERYRLERFILPRLKEYIISDLSEIVINYINKK